MIVQLIRPAAGHRKWLQVMSGPGLPLGLAYIAGALVRAGHEVSVLDAFIAGLDNRMAYGPIVATGLANEEVVARVRPDVEVIGISIMFTVDWLLVADLCERLRRRFPRAVIVLGGEHVTAMPAFCLKTSAADVGVLGEGEQTVVELVAALASGERSRLAGVAGLCFRDGDEVVITAPRSRIADLDGIARPAWELFDLPAYHRNKISTCGYRRDGLMVPILASRGCPYECTFCTAPAMWGRWKARSPRDVVDEIEDYMTRFGASDFHFYDLTTIIRRDWVEELCREILGRGLKLSWQLTSGTRIEKVDAELAVLLQQSGLYYLGLAPESGSEETRKAIKKKLRASDLERATDAALAAGLRVQYFIVVGFPGDDREGLTETLRLAWWAGEKGVHDVGPSIFTPMPGTELFDELLRAGRIVLGEPLLFATVLNMGFVPRLVTTEALGRAEVMFFQYGVAATFFLSKLVHHPAAMARETWAGLAEGADAGILTRALRGVVRSAKENLRSSLAGRRVAVPRIDYQRFSIAELLTPHVVSAPVPLRRPAAATVDAGESPTAADRPIRRSHLRV